MPANPFSPQGPNGASLTQEEWISQIISPLQAESAVMSIPGVQVHTTAVPVHQPLMTESVLSDAAWSNPNDLVLEAEPNTGELVLMGRGVKAMKVIVKISNETLRSSIDSLAGAQRTITNQITKAVDKALLNGSVAAGITGLLPAAVNTPIAHNAGAVNSAYTEMVDALADAESNYADPTSWLMNPRTIGLLRKMVTTQGLPLLAPNLAEANGDQILGRTVVSAPQMPVGEILLIDPRTVHIALDLDGYARVLLEAFADHDQTGILIVSRFDIGCSNPLGLQVITGVV